MPILGDNTMGITSSFLTFLGRGLDTPFRRGVNDFAASEDVEHLKSLISNVLGTGSQSDYTDGELPWRTEFGSLLNHLRHKNNDALIVELARVHVSDALARWVPQVLFRDIDTTIQTGPNGESTVLRMKLRYDIVRVNRPGNRVLLPDVTQVVVV